MATYGQVATLAGLPGRARLVGYALHASAGAELPWHRVVNAEGRLSLARLDPANGLTQRMRLEREGIAFDARGRVRLALCRWPKGLEKAAPISGRRPGPLRTTR